MGGTLDADGRQVQEWVLKEDGLYSRDSQGERRFAELDMSAQVPDPTASVVVLIGPVTRSSGQAAALAFKSRPNCMLLGEPSARGYTTVTDWLTFGPDVSLSLAVGFMTDPKGIPYKLQVLPDQAMDGGDAFDSLMEDKKILKAIEWLDRKPE